MKRFYVLQKLSLICALLLCLQFSWGQTIKISGRVSNKIDTKSLLGVTVSMPDDGVGAESDAEGNYSFEFEKKGRSTVKILAEMVDYVSSEIEVPLGASTDVKLDITLLPTTFTANDVVISATKGSADQQQKDVTVSISVVKQRSIDLQATTNVDKVITQVPGVDNLDGQINIRGSSGYAYGIGSRVMILLDGLPLLSGDAGMPELGMVPVDNVAQVEVMKGASSVMYGSGALGGVVNIITGDASDKPRTSIRIRGGFFDAPANRDLDWDGTSSAYNASAHIFHQRKIGDLSLTAQTDIIKESGYRKGTDKEELRAILHARYQPKKVPGLTIGLNTTYRSDSSGSAVFYDRYYPTKIRIINGTDTTYQLTGGGLTPNAGAGVYRKQFNTRIALDPTIKYLSPSGKHLYWYRGRFLKNDNNTNTGQSSSSYVAYNDFLYQTSLFKDKVKWVTGSTITYAYTKSPELYIGTYDQSFMGVYSQLDGKFGRLNASLGGRLESVKTNVLELSNEKNLTDSLKSAVDINRAAIEKRNTRPIFRAGLNYELARATNIRASFGQAFRVPSIAEYFASVGAGGVTITPNLFKKNVNNVVRPEFGYSAEIGIRQGYQFGEQATGQWRGYLDVAGFTMRYQDMMEFGLDTLTIDGNTGTSTAYFSTRNVADARIMGIEVTTMNTYTAKNFQFNLSGGITYIVPTNLNAVDEKEQIDLSFFNASTSTSNLNDIIKMEEAVRTKVDAPAELKYRTRTLVRLSTGINYKKFGFATNYRYRSFMKSIDQYFYLILGDLNDFRTRHPKGEHVYDFIFSYDINDTNRLSFNIDNATNVEYFAIPGTLAPQRSFTLQYQIKF